MYKYLFFDLDGTIVEPSKGIVNSILYSLEKLNYGNVNPADLLKFIGPPLEYSYMSFLGFSEEKADEAVRTKADAIVCTASGTDIVVKDSSDDNFRNLKLFGKTEQPTTSGKQLINNTAKSQTVNGITFTVNEDNLS